MAVQPSYATAPTGIVAGDTGQIAWGNYVGTALNEIKTLFGAKTDVAPTFTNPTSDYWAYITIDDDGSSTTNWVDRFRVTFSPVSGSDRPTFWLNEYGEGRGMPAKDNTVGYRIFAALDSTGYAARSSSVPIWEITNQRDGPRTTLFGVLKGGEFTMSGNRVGMAYTFASGATVNNTTVAALGLPNGTLILRKV